MPPLFTRTSDIGSRLKVVRELRDHVGKLRDELTDQLARGRTSPGGARRRVMPRLKLTAALRLLVDVGSDTCGIQ